MEITHTTTAMLDGLFDAENMALWTAFDSRYRPIIVGFARNFGLSEADAADVAQETLTRFITEYRKNKYDRDKGRLGAWLVGIARYRVLNLRREQAGNRQLAGESAIADLDDDQKLSVIWEQERRASILREAMEQLKDKTRTDPKTIQAFEMHAIHGLSPQVVADDLEMSVHDVYLAKSRIAQKLRDIVEQIEATYNEDG